MKTLIVLFLIIFALPLFALAQGWQWQNPLPQGNTLNSVDFVDASNGWAVGELGTILHTSDGGVSWDLQHSGVPADLSSVSFVSSLKGWIAGRRGTVLHTEDGGLTWTPQQIGVPFDLSKVTFIDDTTGWVIGLQCYSTVNGGETWTFAAVPGFPVRTDISVLDQQSVWVLMWQSSIARTINSGLTWEMISVENNSLLRCMSFADLNHGWIIGTDSSGFPKTYHTGDGGSTWVALEQRPPDGILQLVFTDTLHGWGLGNSFQNGFVTRTEDGGVTWHTAHINSIYGLLAISVVGDLDQWVVGQRGLLSQTVDGGINWQNQNQTYTNASLSEIDFANRETGIAVGGRYLEEIYSGLILRTSDGVSWQTADSIPNSVLNSVELLPSGNGWVVGEDGLILHTPDFGFNWEPQTSNVQGSLRKVTFADDFCGWIVGLGLVLHTCNGGATWEVQLQDTMTSYFDISCRNPQVAWVSGSSGTIRFTSNGGESWEWRQIPPEWDCLYLVKICFIDDRKGFVTGWGFCQGGDTPTYVSLSTQDSGFTWRTLDRLLEGVTFFDSLNGIGMGDDGLNRTMDGGANWTTIPVPSYLLSPQGLKFVDTDRWYAVGSFGTILRYMDTPESTPEPKPQPPLTFTLSVYPNPFNPSTTLEFNLPHSGKTTLKIFDITGRLVETLTDRFYPQGLHQLTFDGTGLPSGLYLARLDGSGFSTTNKLMLIK